MNSVYNFLLHCADYIYWNVFFSLENHNKNILLEIHMTFVFQLIFLAIFLYVTENMQHIEHFLRLFITDVQTIMPKRVPEGLLLLAYLPKPLPWGRETRIFHLKPTYFLQNKPLRNLGPWLPYQNVPTPFWGLLPTSFCALTSQRQITPLMCASLSLQVIERLFRGY